MYHSFPFLFFNFTILYWFCHISKWIRHRYTCVPHFEPSSLLPPHTIPLGHPSAPAPSIQYRASNMDWRLISYYTCFNAILPNHPTLSLSHRVQKTVLYTSVSFAVSYTGLKRLSSSSSIRGHCYHLSTFHIYALVYCIAEKAMAPHSSTLAWKIPWTEEPGRLQSMGSLRVRHDWATSLSLSTFMHWRRKWQPIPVFLPGESQGWGSLVGCHLWGRTESDTTEAT